MSKAIESAAQWADAKSKMRLKHGTCIKAQKRGDVSLAKPRWDQGATGQANRVGLVSEARGDVDPDTGERVNPNGVKGVRRVDMLEVYHQMGRISDAGFTAGEALRDAWTATQRSKGTDYAATRVDSTSKPDAHIDIQIDRMSDYLAVSKHIIKSDRAILAAVVGDGRTVAHLKQYQRENLSQGMAHLRAALDRLAVAMGG